MKSVSKLPGDGDWHPGSGMSPLFSLGKANRLKICQAAASASRGGKRPAFDRLPVN